MTRQPEIQIRGLGVSVIVLKEDAGTYSVLLLRRRHTLVGEWCQVAGSLEEGETAWQAALRETREETGLELDSLYSADICEQFYEADKDCIVILPVFVGYASPEQDVTLNTEHDAFEWMTFEEAKRRVSFAGQRQVLDHVHNEFVERKPNAWLRIEFEA